ncbi:paxillin [Mucor ambiguus]|uniref:Paxillin n=1 Tax=Mucor ambiguus TaxID=91626 RepID=A0A0C9M741_9FUNG|nr:paxillin [Mucor ambiguus]
MSDISAPCLPTLKCTGCHFHIDIRTLDKHACVPITQTTLTLPLSKSIDIQENPALPPPNVQRRSRERSNALNNSTRRIFQKIKGNDQQYKSTDSSILSPTLSMFSSTSSHQTIPTPRSSEDYIQQYVLKQVDATPIISRKSDDTLIRFESRGRKKPVTETAVLEQLITSMNIKDDLCQACSKFITLCDDEGVKDPITRYSYHQACYCCSLCRVSLSISSSLEYDGKLYCARDYQVMKSRSKPSPKQQQAPLSTPTEMVMPKSCYHCKMTFGNGDLNYKTFRNRIYCNSDFRQLFLPKCQSCHKAVEKEAISATDGKLQGKWHIECFHCQMCRAPFPDSTFYVFENQPYCKTHYHYLNNSLCNRCYQGIENLCAHTAEGWRFHPKCFTCVPAEIE